jgi:3'(2'), 5'-bisphosphate nucleotidase
MAFDCRGDDFRPLIDALLPAVRAAGAVEVAIQARGPSVTHKADKSPVTEADQAAEALLLAALGQAAPGTPVVAEEEVAAGRVPQLGDCFFLVDPLDGTRDFIAGRQTFTVNVGLIRAGRPAFGLIYAPAQSRLFATLHAGSAAETRVAPDPVSHQGASDLVWRPLSTQQGRAGPLKAVLSRSAAKNETSLALLARHEIAEEHREVVGSALKFGLLAAGEADVYPRFGGTCEWDTAAGEAILAAAGGSVADVRGRPLIYGKVAEKFINPHFVAWARPPRA